MPVSVSAIIIRAKDNKVFVTKRSNDKKFSPGKWETVGGNVEVGETLEEALKREIREEINTEIKNFYYFKDYQWNERIFKTFVVELEKEPIPNKEDFEDWGWFSKEEVEKMDFAINCKERIIDYYNKKQKSEN